jgi:enamine deaminase RidA (YjgF/YER057c/UK114 family)
MPHAIHDIGVASQIGAYSDAVEARPNLRWLLTSGTPGLSTTGDLPKDISGQAELAWGHVVRMLERAGMSVADLVKVNQYLTRAEDIPAYEGANAVPRRRAARIDAPRHSPARASRFPGRGRNRRRQGVSRA